LGKFGYGFYFLAGKYAIGKVVDGDFGVGGWECYSVGA
jgi:hypothetical protein